MDEFRKDEIIYEEQWQQVDTPVYRESASLDEPEHKAATVAGKPKIHRRRLWSLSAIQLLFCAIIVFVVFILKAMDSDAYDQLREWYTECMSETLISDSTFEDIDLSHYFPASADQLSSTQDEIHSFFD